MPDEPKSEGPSNEERAREPAPAPPPEALGAEEVGPEGQEEIAGPGAFQTLFDAARTGDAGELADKVADFTRRIGAKAEKAVEQWEQMAKQWSDRMTASAAAQGAATPAAAAQGATGAANIADLVRREAEKAAERALRAIKVPPAADVEALAQRLAVAEASIAALKLEVTALRRAVEERMPR